MAQSPTDPDATLPPADSTKTAAWGGSGSMEAGANPSIPGYTFGRVLGRGGMGVVYQARQVLADRDVAIKMILGDNHAGSIETVRFRAEVVAVSRLQHPNIVAIYD